jgi:hypothetical protein
METLTDAIDRLRAAGYALDLFVAPGAVLRCGGCQAAFDAATMQIDEVVRFEGESDPDDEAILFALHGPCGHRGLYSVAFGAQTPTEDVDVVGALRPS